MATPKQKTIDTILQKLRERYGPDSLDYAKKRRLLERQRLRELQLVLADMDKREGPR